MMVDIVDDMPDIEPVSPIYRDYLKRGIDLTIALILFVCLIIPMTMIAIAIKLDSDGPAFFAQKRLGKNGKVFNMYKFRTMIVNAEFMGSGVYSEKGDSRVTHVGSILRATSIDEFPQLFNIIKGDMSFIGPRPPLTYHPWPIDEYTEEQLHMFDVRPGISGWAQIHGRKNVEWNHRIELNVWYVRHMRFCLDAKILFNTIIKVIANEDNVSVGKTIRLK